MAAQTRTSIHTELSAGDLERRWNDGEAIAGALRLSTPPTCCRVPSPEMRMDTPEPSIKRLRSQHGPQSFVPVSTMPVFGVANQGTQKTCVPTSVALAASHGLLHKQGVVIGPQKLADRFEYSADCWDEGMTINEFCAKWNGQHQSTCVKNDDGTELYLLKLEASEPIWDIGDAYEQLVETRRHGINMLVCAIKDGRLSHAVTLDIPLRRSKPNMSAINSHGARRAIIDVTELNFEYAVLIDPLVVGWKKDGGNARQRMPSFTTAYKEMKAGEAEQEEMMDDHVEAEFSQPHHPDSDEAELAALKNIAQSHPELHVGCGNVGRNGRPSKSGWRGVFPENDTERKGP